MTDSEFLKKLNVLYVEDDEGVRAQIGVSLQKFVNNLYITKNGEEALSFYKKLSNQNIRVDAIISDINMPIMNGIELLKEIRIINEEIPFLFTTAHSEEEYLLSAIKFNATGYLLKPVDLLEVVDKLNKVCHSYHQMDTIRKQKIELERYLSAIDNVAIVSKTDTKGKITFVNDIFSEIAQYSKDELYGKSHNIVRHPDMPKSAFTDLWKTIQSGNTWQGKVKNRAKDGSAYYVNATIIPIFDDLGEDIIEYVGIRFLTTDDELEKREFKKKVIQNIQDGKRKESDYLKRIQLLEEQLINYTHIDVSTLNKQILESQDKNNKLTSQILHYEEEIKKLKEKNTNITILANEKVKKASVIAIELKKSNDKLKKDNDTLINEITNKKKVILDLEKRIKEKVKTIEDLHDVINFKEKQLEEKQLST